MKKMLILAITLAAVTSLALPALSLQAPMQITFDAPGKGEVVFDHAGHEQIAGDCTVCHHMGVGNGKCDGCHGKTPIAPKMKDALHKLCRDCHAAKDVAKKRNCSFCHN